MFRIVVALIAIYGFKEFIETDAQLLLPTYYSANQVQPEGFSDGLPSKPQLLNIIQYLLRAVHRLQENQRRQDVRITAPSSSLMQSEPGETHVHFQRPTSLNSRLAFAINEKRNRKSICKLLKFNEINDFFSKLIAGVVAHARSLCFNINEQLETPFLQQVHPEIEGMFQESAEPKEYLLVRHGASPKGLDSTNDVLNLLDQSNSYTKANPFIQQKPLITIPLIFGSLIKPSLPKKPKHKTPKTLSETISIITFGNPSKLLQAVANPYAALTETNTILHPLSKHIIQESVKPVPPLLSEKALKRVSSDNFGDLLKFARAILNIQEIPEKLPKEIPAEIPKEITEEISKEIPEKISEEIPEKIPEEIPEEMPKEEPEEVPVEISKELPEVIPEKPDEGKHDKNLEKTPEGITDEVIEEIPKEINTMFNVIEQGVAQELKGPVSTETAFVAVKTTTGSVQTAAVTTATPKTQTSSESPTVALENSLIESTNPATLSLPQSIPEVAEKASNVSPEEEIYVQAPAPPPDVPYSSENLTEQQTELTTEGQDQVTNNLSNLVSESTVTPTSSEKIHSVPPSEDNSGEGEETGPEPASRESDQREVVDETANSEGALTKIKRKKREIPEDVDEDEEVENRIFLGFFTRHIRSFLFGGSSGNSCTDGIVRRIMKFLAGFTPSIINKLLFGLPHAFANQNCSG